MISTPRAANTGRGLPAPNGASDRMPAATPPVISRNARPPSMRSRGIRSSGPSVSSATSLTARRSARIRLASRVRPAACLWPPKRVSRWAQRSSAPSMSKREKLRHEPCAMPSSTDRTIAGRWNVSISFDATIPITPRCQPSPATTRIDRAPTSGSVWTIFLAAARISASSSWRLTFSPSSCSASCRASSASASSSARKSRAAMSGELMRPAALTRGAIMKPM